MPLPLTEVIIAGQTGHVEHHNTIHDVVNRVEYFDTGIYTESFNKADSDTLGPDLTWTEVTGDSDIVSNTAEFPTNGHMLARAEVDLGSPDHFSQMTVTQLDATLTDARKNHVGVVCRKDNSSTLTYYDGRVTRGGATIEGYKIYKRIAGTETVLWTLLTTLPALPFTIRLEVEGTSLRFYVNGTLQQTITDSSITTGNYTGMKVFRDTAATAPRADAFQAGTMASVSSFPRVTDVFTDGTQSSQFQGKVADALLKVESAYISGGMGQTLDTGIFTESFNKADSDTLGPDLTWTEITGDTDVVSNTAEFVGLGHSLARAQVDLGSSDHFASATVTFLDAAQTDARKNIVGVACRKDATSTQTFYQGRITRGGVGSQGYNITKYVGGVETVLVTSLGILPETPFTIRFEVQGTALRFYVNDALRLSTTDSSITTGNYTGIKAMRDTLADAPRIDSFQAVPLSVLSPFPALADSFVDGMQSSVFQTKVADAVTKIENILLGRPWVNAQAYGFLPTNTGLVNRVNLQKAVNVAVSQKLDLYIPGSTTAYPLEFTNTTPGVTNWITVPGDLRVRGDGSTQTVIDVYPKATFSAANGGFEFRVFSCTLPVHNMAYEGMHFIGPTTSNFYVTVANSISCILSSVSNAGYGTCTVRDVKSSGRWQGNFDNSYRANGRLLIENCDLWAEATCHSNFEASQSYFKRETILLNNVFSGGTTAAENTDAQNHGILSYNHQHVSLLSIGNVFNDNQRDAIKQYSGSATGSQPRFSIHIGSTFRNCGGFTIITPSEEVTTIIDNCHSDKGVIAARNDTRITNSTLYGVTGTTGMETDFEVLIDNCTIMSERVSEGVGYSCIDQPPEARMKITNSTIWVTGRGLATSTCLSLGTGGTGKGADVRGNTFIRKNALGVSPGVNSNLFILVWTPTGSLDRIVIKDNKFIGASAITAIEVRGTGLKIDISENDFSQLTSGTALNVNSTPANICEGRDNRFGTRLTGAGGTGNGRQRILARRAQNPTDVASAGNVTLSPDYDFHMVTGTTTINNIYLVSSTDLFMTGTVTLVAVGAWATSATGNIKAKTGAARAVDQAYTFHFDPATALWYEVA